MDVVKVKKISPNAKIPKKATKGAAGYDLYSAQSMIIPARGHKCVSTDIQARSLTSIKLVNYQVIM